MFWNFEHYILAYALICRCERYAESIRIARKRCKLCEEYADSEDQCEVEVVLRFRNDAMCVHSLGRRRRCSNSCLVRLVIPPLPILL